MRHISTHREAVGAGLLTGVIAMVPALLFLVVFPIVLFGTLIETATGLIHAFNERIAGVFSAAGCSMPSLARPAFALGLVVVGALLSRLGIVALVGRGYGTVSWGFLVIYVVPLLTWGLWKIKTVDR